MAVGRAERRSEREAQIVAVFGKEQAPIALDLIDITDLAWHDCYGEATPSRSVIEDMLTVSAVRVPVRRWLVASDPRHERCQTVQ